MSGEEQEKKESPQEIQRDYFQKKYREISDIEGIGPATVSKLAGLGFKTVSSLATATRMELEKGGIGEEMARKAIEEARKAVSISFITADELIKIRENKKYLSTGCTTLNKLLVPGPLQGTDFMGGIETQGITEFYGEFGSGKSQMCHQLAVTAQLPESEGGFNAKVLYIDTEAVFQPERVTQIASRFDLDPEKVLSNVIYAEAYTSAHQIALLESADQIIKEENVKVIIVDSLTSHFRGEYLGREMLAARQQKLNSHLQKLMRLSRVFNAAAVITNQVSARPDSFFGNHPTPIGGHILGHIVHTRVYFRKGRNILRIAKIVASPSIPESEAPFSITDYGLVSDEDIPPEENDAPEE